MACSNCFNGCTETISDQCVKYTGINIPQLGISNGDTLAHVEKQLIDYLQNIMTGDSIHPTLPYNTYCELVTSNLPPVGPYTLNHVLNALVLTACQLDLKIGALIAAHAALDSDYITLCLPGVTGDEGTHTILQATINGLCTVSSNLTALALELHTNYLAAGAEMDAYLANYLALHPPGVNALIYYNMVPYTAVEYYGPLTNFDLSGAGIGNWTKIYLCNGQNGTPDKRGRVTVGATTMPGGPMSPAVDPALPGNLPYALSQVNGSNTVTLGIGQIPGHTHLATVTLNDPGHNHTVVGNIIAGEHNGTHGAEATNRNIQTTSTSFTGITATVVNAPAGGSGPHNNVQPGIGAYYIM